MRKLFIVDQIFDFLKANMSTRLSIKVRICRSVVDSISMWEDFQKFFKIKVKLKDLGNCGFEILTDENSEKDWIVTSLPISYTFFTQRLEKNISVCFCFQSHKQNDWSAKTSIFVSWIKTRLMQKMKNRENLGKKIKAIS